MAFASACRDACPPLVWQAHRVMQGVRQRRPVGKTHCYLTFLTLINITFDSLSEKIKNLRLVINFKFLFQGEYSCRISKKSLPTWL